MPVGDPVPLQARDEKPEGLGRQTFRKDGIGRAIALEDAMRHQPARRSFGFDLRLRLAKRQRFGLREQIRHQQVMLMAKRIQRLAEADEVARHEPGSLVDELIE